MRSVGWFAAWQVLHRAMTGRELSARLDSLAEDNFLLSIPVDQHMQLARASAAANVGGTSKSAPRVSGPLTLPSHVPVILDGAGPLTLPSRPTLTPRTAGSRAPRPVGSGWRRGSMTRGATLPHPAPPCDAP